MDIKKEVTVEKYVEIKLTGKDIVNLLVEQGVIGSKNKADVKFKVPGGGDWSNMTIDIDKDNTINVSYKTVEKE